MIEKKIEEVKRKINEKNLEFTEDDKIVLNLYPELTKDVFQYLSESIDNWNNKVFDIIFNENTISYIPEEAKKNFWINYIKNALAVEGDFTLEEEEFEEFFLIIGVDEETKEEIRKIVRESDKVNKNLNLNEFNIKKALEEKRFDLISQIDSDLYDTNRILPETISELIRVFPYDEYESPRFFASYPELLKDKIDKLSLVTIVNLISKQTNNYIGSFNWEEDNTKNHGLPLDKLTEQLLIKLKEEKYEKPQFYKIDLNCLNIFYGNNPRVLKQIAEITVNNNILDFIPSYYQNTPDIKEFCCNKIIEHLNQTTDKMCIDKLCQIISENEVIVDAIINNGFIDKLIEYNLLEIYPDKKSKVFENIENNNPRYQNNKKFHFTENIEKHEDIIHALIKKGFVKEIDLYSFYSMKSSVLKLINTLATTYPDIQFSSFYGVNNVAGIEHLFITFLKQKKYNYCLELVNNYYDDKVFTKSLNLEKELVINSIENSLHFAVDLIKKVPEELFNNQQVLEIYLKETFLAEQLINYLNHHEELDHMYNHEMFMIAKDSLAASLKVDVNRLIRLEQKFGAKLIRYANNENILKLLRLNDEEFEKIMDLFPSVQYTLSDLESAYDSLKQYEFSKAYPEVISIFPTILHAIEDNNNEIINNAINEIYPILNSFFFKMENEKYQFPEGYDESNPKLFVTFVIEKIKNTEGEKREKYITILHDITNYYISRKRDLYRETYDMPRELELPYELDEKSFEREFLKYLIENSRAYFVDYTIDKNGQKQIGYTTLEEYLVIKLESYGIERNLARVITRYQIPSLRYTNGYSEDLIKAHYKYLIKAMKEIAQDKPKHQIFEDYSKNNIRRNLDEMGRVKRNYHVGPIGLDMYEVLANLRIDVLKDCILGDEEVYESLKTLMTKKKLHLLPEVLKNLLVKNKINISDDLNNIGAFISYYAQIYAKEKSALASNNRPTDNINMNITNILINAEVYAGVSSIYSQILGSEDSKLIKGNPGPNSATQKLANDGRLKEAIELTEKLFRRQAVTIPTFNECVKLSSDKTMRVVAGNFTHPSNLTHGERTGACMRIGGVGESLFLFAINNPNGFHIRFEDPTTGQYISRVTGFRNGNTVFLNELRNSCNPETYDDMDVIEACKIAGEMLIELSKNSPCPIENVVVHRAYATNIMREENVQLNVRNIKEGLPSFYTDVNSHPIILATTAKKGKYVPVDLDNSRVPTYQPAREIPIVYKDATKAVGKISRVASIKRLLNGENYEYIASLEFENNIIYAIVSEDWYIYVDELGNIHKDYIDIDPRAKEELAEYLIKLETQLATEPITKEDTYGF